jgi:hypothetical protein
MFGPANPDLSCDEAEFSLPEIAGISQRHFS